MNKDVLRDNLVFLCKCFVKISSNYGMTTSWSVLNYEDEAIAAGWRPLEPFCGYAIRDISDGSYVLRMIPVKMNGGKIGLYTSIKKEPYEISEKTVENDIFREFIREFMKELEYKTARKRKDYRFYATELKLFYDQLAAGKLDFDCFDETCEPPRGICMLECGCADIEINLMSKEQTGHDEKGNMEPVIGLYICIYDNKEKTWNSYGYADDLVDFNWSSEDWEEQLEKRMFFELKKYTANSSAHYVKRSMDTERDESKACNIKSENSCPSELKVESCLISQIIERLKNSKNEFFATNGENTIKCRIQEDAESIAEFLNVLGFDTVIILESVRNKTSDKWYCVEIEKEREKTND